MEKTRRIWPTESTKQCTHGFTETEGGSMGPAGILHKVLLVYVVAVSLVLFVILLTVGVHVSLTL